MSDKSREAALREKRRYWKEHIDSWKASGLKQSQYCRQHDLKLYQFVYWRKKYLPRTAAPISLVRVPLPEQNIRSLVQSSAKPLRVIVGADRRIEVERGFDPIALQQLVHTLERM
ncbi:MAG: hypothetical protein K9L59_09710 [Desulfobacterales bacterium]|nr:hypothetical protein [Desulfobacterales bacterium]